MVELTTDSSFDMRVTGNGTEEKEPDTLFVNFLSAKDKLAEEPPYSYIIRSVHDPVTDLYSFQIAMVFEHLAEETWEVSTPLDATANRAVKRGLAELVGFYSLYMLP